MRHSTSGSKRWILVTAACGVLSVGCSSPGNHDSTSVGASPSNSAAVQPLTLSKLRSLLLTPADLGAGYTQDAAKTEEGNQYDDVSIQGCPSLEKLDSDSSGMHFATEAQVSYTYHTDSGLGEELHSDAPATLSKKLQTLFSTYISCPSYTLTSGTTPIEVTIAKSDTPDLGDEQFAYTSTMQLPAGPQILKTLAVRQGNVAVMLVGAPALVDRHIEAAVAKLGTLG